MFYGLVRSVQRKGSLNRQFVQRIPADVRAGAAGLKLAVPLGEGEFHHLQISPKADAVRFSLRTRDPTVAKVRQANAAAFFEEVWRSLRSTKPMALTHRQATALAGTLYRAWTGDDERDRTIAIQHTPQGWIRVRALPEELEAAFEGQAGQLEDLIREGDSAALEQRLGPIVDRLLLSRGILAVDAPSRVKLLEAFGLALQDALKTRSRHAGGDFSPDPKAERFPEWRPPENEAAPAATPEVSLMGLADLWWREASAAGRKPSTYRSYHSTMRRFTAHLKHDDAARVSPDDVLAFKDARLAEVTKSGKRVSAKTVKDSDLAGLKTVFGWALVNRKVASNPAAGLTIKVGKAAKLRGKGFTDEEARAILTAASAIELPAKRAPTLLAKRWVPWLCCYTGARVGEIAQLRKQDVRREGELWIIKITPKAGTVKTNEARDVVLHAHIIEQGFPAFVSASPAGPLFLRPAKDGSVLGPLHGLKNRLAAFARAIVTDSNVAPNHGWRHRFKTVGMEAGVAPRILDAIQGQAARTVGDNYGEVTTKTIAAAIEMLPRVQTKDATS